MKVYITASSAITPQNTFDHQKYLQEWVTTDQPYRSVVDPDYRSLIDPKLARRMSRVIKMSVAAGSQALADAGVEQPEAIIVGTGLGCMQDTEKFLTDLISRNESTLSPTAFIQSTHNTMAGQLALLLQCPDDNFTYVNKGHSFENALTDAVLRIREGASDVLIGGADEMTPALFKILKEMECVGSTDAPDTWGEGAAFFVMSREKKAGAVTLEDFHLFNHATPAEMTGIFQDFMHKNKRDVPQVDAVLLGLNDSTDDPYYSALLENLDSTVPVVDFKKVTGQYFTASAYACHLAHVMLQKQQLYPGTLRSGTLNRPLRHILIYNHWKGTNHSLVLVSL